MTCSWVNNQRLAEITFTTVTFGSRKQWFTVFFSRTQVFCFVRMQNCDTHTNTQHNTHTDTHSNNISSQQYLVFMSLITNVTLMKSYVDWSKKYMGLFAQFDPAWTKGKPKLSSLKQHFSFYTQKTKCWRPRKGEHAKCLNGRACPHWCFNYLTHEC